MGSPFEKCCSRHFFPRCALSSQCGKYSGYSQFSYWQLQNCARGYMFTNWGSWSNRSRVVVLLESKTSETEEWKMIYPAGHCMGWVVQCACLNSQRPKKPIAGGRKGYWSAIIGEIDPKSLLSVTLWKHFCHSLCACIYEYIYWINRGVQLKRSHI